jgi:phage terminase large subunit
MDDSEKIKSINNITDIFIEEASELSLEEVTQLDLRLRGNAEDLQMYFAYNPVSKANWTYIRYHSPEAIIPENTKIIKSTYKDNPYLSKEYIESLESLISNNRQYYNVYVLGEYCSMDKMVYSNWKIEDFDKNTIIGTSCVGLDWGFTHDPTALIASIVDEQNKIIYIHDEFYQKGMLNDKIANIIKYKGYSKSRIVADCAENKSIAELKRDGITRIEASYKGGDSVNHGIQRVQQYQIIVHPSCTFTIAELENYCYIKDKISGEYLNKAIDKYNHLMDALRYSIQILGKTHKLKTMSKKILGL